MSGQLFTPAESCVYDAYKTKCHSRNYNLRVVLFFPPSDHRSHFPQRTTALPLPLPHNPEPRNPPPSPSQQAADTLIKWDGQRSKGHEGAAKIALPNSWIRVLQRPAAISLFSEASADRGATFKMPLPSARAFESQWKPAGGVVDWVGR
jgi:hypothetical protein